VASVTKARLEGSVRAVEAAGLEWAGVPVELVPVTSAEGCLAGARALLDRAPGVTAVFAFSDPLALAIREAARERGLSVPGDLSIVGFDDTAPAGEGLTSIHQPLRDKGRIAAERLLGALSREPPPAGSELLPTRLVVRASTAQPPDSSK
jgi:DNA-binding LacI/PurR family transcriptional regulator